MVTFFGSASAVDFGKTMLNTPLVMDALMSSFCTKSHQYLHRCCICISEVLALTPCGSDKLLANLPYRRSRITYPPSLSSEDDLSSPDTVRTLFWTSIDTSSFCRPGSSKVTLTLFVSLSQCTSTLCVTVSSSSLTQLWSKLLTLA